MAPALESLTQQAVGITGASSGIGLAITGASGGIGLTTAMPAAHRSRWR